MSRRKKLEKFAELLSYKNVFEMTDIGSELIRHSADSVFSPKGLWHEYPYDKSQPLCVELACGRGEYTLELAQLFPERNYIGVDIKGSRIHQGATFALKQSLGNVAFLRIRIEQIELFFDEGEIDEIWITFPDPFPAKPNRRLSALIFLDAYHRLLSSKALIHLKTDDRDLYDFSIESAEAHTGFEIKVQYENISEIRLIKPELNISTYYEKMHIANKKTIKYLQLEKIG